MNTTPATAPDDSFRGTYATIRHWRGVAVALIFLFHTTLPVDASSSFGLRAIEWLSRFGLYGVHLFAILSGYSIANHVWQLAHDGRQPIDFLRDRFLRLYPLYWITCLLAIGLGIAGYYPPFQLWIGSLNGRWFGATGDVLLIASSFGFTPLLSISWALIYGVAIYLLIALGFWFYRLGCPLRLLTDIGLGLAVIGLLQIHFLPLYVLRLWPEFVMGAMVFLALYYRHNSSIHRRLCLAGIAGLAAAAWLVSNRHMAMLYSVSAALALLLYYLKRWDEPISRSWLLRPLRGLGRISYSLYLVHTPLSFALAAAIGKWAVALPSPLTTQLIVSIGSLLGGCIFYKLCEQPLENWRHARKPPQGQRDDLIFG